MAWTLAPSFAAAARPTMHRYRHSRTHSPYGVGEPSVGRSTNPRRIAGARSRCFRTHGVAVSARPAKGSVPDVADILCEPPGPLGLDLAAEVVVPEDR